MFKKLSLSLILFLAAGTAFAGTEKANYANSPSSEGTTGFVAGMVLGGAAGGPPGVVVGAVIGVLMGDGFHARNQAADLQADLFASGLEIDAVREEALLLQREFQLAQQELDRLRSNPRVLPAVLATAPADPCCDNTVLSLHFRSGSSAIESHYEEELQGLIKLAKQMPSASVEITGYADRNGDVDGNLKLSRERSDSVKRFFNAMGIENSSIKTIAYGETQPLQAAQSFETDFFDRRVIVRLRDTSQHMLTQSPDGE